MNGYLAKTAKQTVFCSLKSRCEYTSLDKRSFLKEHYLKISMCRKGNCHDSTVAEVSSSTQERVKRMVDKTSDAVLCSKYQLHIKVLKVDNL